MKTDTGPSLRDQIIEAMTAYAEQCGREGYTKAALFDEAIMPVLKQAMDAGALLVGRNTRERIPVPQAITRWLEEVSGHVRLLQHEEAIISRRQLLRVLYQFGENAEKALAQAKQLETPLQ